MLASEPVEVQQEVVNRLTPAQRLAFRYDWRGVWARDNQIQPPGNWVKWMLLAGRGFGKTRTGAETVREWASKPLPGPIHLVAPTAGDIRKVMIEGPLGGLLSCYPPGQRPNYEPSKGHLITWPNGNIAYCFSADEPERLRGPQCSRFWADELAAWRFGQEAWDNLMFGFRIGDELRGVITTTPKPTALVKAIASDKMTVVTRGSTYENRDNLAEQFYESVVSKYEGTRLGRQELNAEILEDVPGALWTRGMIDATRVSNPEMRWDMLVRVVVAIDPAVTAGEESDETGIIVAARARSGHVVVLDDLSCRESPLGWAKIAVAAYRSRRADRIVAEVNNGGDMVERNIRAFDDSVSYRPVRASRGKYLRAEPVAALYERGMVHHLGSFPQLEDQMCAFVPGADKSPDRLDALVWAITDLAVDQEIESYTVLRPIEQISPI